MPTLTVENYVKSIYQICASQEKHSAATGQIARALDVSPGTVTSMLKTLGESGLATYTPYEGARLTDSGVALALRVLRRHRLIELFLSKTLSMTWDEVHEEAENMEHAVSDLLIDRIDEFLGNPKTDPHGDPIPAADGTIDQRNLSTLSSIAVGEGFHLERVVQQSSDFLRFLTDTGLSIGSTGKVMTNNPAAGVVAVLVNQREISLGIEVAEKLMVTKVDS